jgi:TRAP-type C4-dicarboxylate transport system substrate-binding protein
MQICKILDNKWQVKRKRILLVISMACIGLIALTFTMTACAPIQQDQTLSASKAAKPIKLIFAASDPDTTFMADAQKWWAMELEKRTNGAVVVDFYWDGSIAAMTDTLEVTQKGIADICNIIPPYFGEVFPIHNFQDIYAYHDKPLARIMTNQAVDDIFPEAEAEWTEAGLKRLYSMGLAQHHIGSIKPIRTLEDFKGLRIRATGKLNTAIFTSLGARPIAFPTTEACDQLKKGMIDGELNDYDCFIRFGSYELINYITRLYIGANPCLTTCMNIDTWNQLPPDVKKVLMELRDEFPIRYNELMKKQYMETSIPLIQIKGIEIIDLPPEDLVAIYNYPLVRDVKDSWVDTLVTNKPELSPQKAEEIKDTYLTLLNEFGDQYPDTLEPYEK